MFRITPLAIAVAMTALLAGCASFAVTEESLVEKTAFALGLDAGDFTISDRQDSGVDTRYVATTKKGAVYRCYVTGSITTMGRTVSDAICNRKGEPARNPLTN